MLSFVKEFWAFLRVRKKFWLLPILMMLLIVGGLLLLAQGSAVAPFIYTLF
jgi:competence protein ComGC